MQYVPLAQLLPIFLPWGVLLTLLGGASRLLPAAAYLRCRLWYITGAGGGVGGGGLIACKVLELRSIRSCHPHPA